MSTPSAWFLGFLGLAALTAASAVYAAPRIEADLNDRALLALANAGLRPGSAPLGEAVSVDGRDLVLGPTVPAGERAAVRRALADVHGVRAVRLAPVQPTASVAPSDPAPVPSSRPG